MLGGLRGEEGRGASGPSAAERIFKTAVQAEPRAAHTLIIFSLWPFFSLRLPAWTPAHAIPPQEPGLKHFSWKIGSHLIKVWSTSKVLGG